MNTAEPSSENAAQGKPQSGNYLAQGWLVIVLSLAYGAGLAGVQIALNPKIQENIKAETYDQIPHIVTGADALQTVEHRVTGQDGREVIVYQAFTADGIPVGWVIPGQTQGFADKILLLVGLDRNLETITGMFVLSQKETPGLGDYITASYFRDRFKGLSADTPVKTVKNEPIGFNEVKALTGATISSVSVANAINSAIQNLRGAIQNLPNNPNLNVL